MSRKPFAVAAFVAFVLSFVLAGGCLSKGGLEKTEPPTQSKEVAAIVNGARIYFGDVNEEYASLTPSQKLSITKADALSFLIEREILYQEAARQGLKATEGEVKLEYGHFLAASNLTETELKVQLSTRNSSVEWLMLALKKQLLINKLLDKKVPKQFVIKHEDAEAFYNSSGLAAQGMGIPFEQAEKSIVDLLTGQKQQAARENYISSLKDRADVVIVAVPG